MTTPSERRKALADILAQRVLVLDGAMGTMLQLRNLTAEDFGGPVLEGCNESLNRTRPDVVLDIHRAYLTAGSDAIETNTFNCDSISLLDYGLQDDVREELVARAFRLEPYRPHAQQRRLQSVAASVVRIDNGQSQHITHECSIARRTGVLPGGPPVKNSGAAILGQNLRKTNRP